MTVQSLRVAAFALCLMIVASGVAFSADKTFSISKSLPKVNSHQRMAVNSQTGDVLIVFSQSDPADNDFGQIYAVLCKRLENGKYKVKKAQLVSPATGTHGRPDVAYNPATNQFIVIWDTMQVEADRLTQATKVFSRLLNAVGKPVGAPVTTLDSKRGDSFVYVHTITSSAAPAADATFLLLWNRYPIGWDNRTQTGMWSVLLNKSGVPVNTPSQVVQGSWQDDTSGPTGRFWFFGVFPESVVTNQNGATVGTGSISTSAADAFFMVGVTKLIGPIADESREAHIVKLGAGGKFQKAVLLENALSDDTRVIQLSSKLFLTTWYKDDPDFTHRNRRFNTTVKLIKKASAPLKGSTAWFSDLVKLGNNSGGYQASVPPFASTSPSISGGRFDGKYAGSPGLLPGKVQRPASRSLSTNASVAKNDAFVLGRYVKASGKSKGGAKKLFSHGGALRSIRAIAIPGTNDVFVAWVKRLSDSAMEVWGFSFKAK